MGFLDAFTSNDPQSEAMRQGLLQMGLALMQAKGNAGQILGQAGEQGVSGMQAFQDRQFKQKLQQEALAEIARKKVLQGREDTSYEDAQRLAKLPLQFQQPAQQVGNAATIAQTGNLAPTIGNAAIQSANAKPGFDMQGYMKALYSSGIPGSVREALAVEAQQRKDAPTIHALGQYGGTYIGPDGRPQIIAPAVPPDHRTDKIKTYEYAVKQGYKGSLADYEVLTSSERARVWADARERSAANIAAAKEKVAQGGALSPEDARLMADQYIAGDKSVLVGLGRGAQTAQNIVNVRRAIREGLQARGMTGADMAARLSEYTGLLAAQRTAGTRSANIEVAGTAFEQVVPIAKAASADVARSGFLPFGKAQIMFDEQTNNVAFRKFAAANNGIVNLYARAINPTGVGTVHDKEHAREILLTAHDNESYQATVDQLLAEVRAERAGLPGVRKALAAEVANRDKTPAPPASGTLTPAEQAELEQLRNRFKK